MDASPLYDLLLALFDNEAELRRFLAAVGLAEVEQRLAPRKGESVRSAALDVSRAIEELDLVNEALLSALAQRDTSRGDDVWAVGEFYGVRRPGEVTAEDGGSGDLPPTPLPPPYEIHLREAAPPGPPAMPSSAASDKYADYTRELEAALEALPPVDTVGAALDGSKWPWTAAAAVLGSFRPTSLRPLPTGSEYSEAAVTALSAVVYTTFDGRWALGDAVRAGALARLHREGWLDAALEANQHESDPVRDWMRRLRAGDNVRLSRLDSTDLEALDSATRWLQPLGIGSQVARGALYAVLERRRLIDPLRALVGTDFRGRTNELADVEEHIRGGDGSPVMLLHGPGGVGKSTLIGKVLLDLEDGFAGQVIPFAYVDFDKRENDPNNALTLLEQIVAQMRLLFSASIEVGRELANLEGIITGSDVAYAADFLNLDAEFDRLDLNKLVLLLAERLRANGGDGSAPQMVLVLDTFEEVQMQGPGPVDVVLDLVRRFVDALPGFRAIVSGRSDVANIQVELGTTAPVEEIHLGDLDEASASALLERLGVADGAMRSLIIARFGGSPLTLRLAAEALRRVGSPEEAFGDVVSGAHMLAEVALEQVQGVLYSRILGHIGDPTVVRVAHPGLAVRRVDIGVIRDVLAAPCNIDPDDAQHVFDKLRREVSLFQLEDDGSLRHRQDVRRLMLRAMVDEPRLKRQVDEIHRRAAEYYAADDRPLARAEELYHRLMCDEDPRALASLWNPELRRSLASALEEPLSSRARQWLRRRLGRDSGDDRDLWDQEEWELSAADVAGSWLTSGQPARALEVLRERKDRAPGSPLYALEVRALIATGQLDDAQQALDRGMTSALECGDRALQLSLAELAVGLAAGRRNPAAIVTASRAAARLADLTGEKERAIHMLCECTEELRRLGATTEAAKLASDVARRFGELPADVVRSRPDLVREVLHAAGPTESTVVARAAVELGDALRDRVFRDDTFALTRLLNQTSEEGRPLLDALAAEVGLTGSSWDRGDLASSLTNSGRIGQAVLLGLDYATDEAAARDLVVNQLVHPTAGPRSI